MYPKSKKRFFIVSVKITFRDPPSQYYFGFFLVESVSEFRKKGNQTTYYPVDYNCSLWLSNHRFVSQRQKQDHRDS